MSSTSFPKARRGRPQIHPWDEWADGKMHKLTQGKDFTSNIPSFQALVHRTAKVRNMRAKTHVDNNTVIIQFYESS